MKRSVVMFVLVAVLVLALTGCKSQDYNKALELFESGQYSQAMAVFADLADYENSAEMVRECSYRIAVETMEAGDYETALSLFAEQGEYSDSLAMMKKCCYSLSMEAMEQKEYARARAYLEQAGDHQDARQKLLDFPREVLTAVLQEQGELVFESSEPAYSVTLRRASDHQIGIDYYLSAMLEDVEQMQQVTMLITWGEVEAQLEGRATGNILIDNDRGKTYIIDESAKGVLAIDAYRPGDKIVWGEHWSWCKNGNYPNTVPLAVVCALPRDGGDIVQRMVGGVEQILQTQNLGITLADLGFASVVAAG